jgi:hypothetical protein
VHHGPDITGFQTFGLNVGGQNHALVFLNAHLKGRRYFSVG